MTVANEPDCFQEQIEDLKNRSRHYERRQAEKAGLDPDWFMNKPVPLSSGYRRESC